MTVATQMKRRDFLKTGAAIGGGLLLNLYVPDWAPARAAQSTTQPVALNAFVHIGSDDLVTVISNHSEMGQGIYTSLPMLIAEELEADWSKIRVQPAPVAAVYNHTVYGIQMTGGSTTTNSEYDRFRKMGAMARVMLISAAAQSWGVDTQSCHAEKGFVVHAASGRRASFGSLAEAAAKLEPPKDVALKDPKGFHHHRQVNAAAGHAFKNQWHRAIWARCLHSGDAYGSCSALARLWWESFELQW